MSGTHILQYYKITNKGHAPVKTLPTDAGYDLRSANCTIIIYSTDIAVKLPPGTFGRIAPGPA